jgi:hypothetical protein
MVEATIGNAVGTAFCIFFLLLSLKKVETSPNPSEGGGF